MNRLRNFNPGTKEIAEATVDIANSDLSAFLPNVILSSKNLMRKCIFMVDSGSAVNIMKINLLVDIAVDIKDRLILQGITRSPVETIGSVIFEIVGKIVKFHVVSEDIAFLQGGILGSEFLRDNDATLDYKAEVLKIKDVTIPFFVKRESIIPKRSTCPASFIIFNPEVKAGYIPLTQPVEGLYF